MMVTDTENLAPPRAGRREWLGLGVIEANTLGITLYWVNYYSALLHGMWWWFLPPVIIIIMLFIGLFSLSAGLDELANPRRRRAV